MPKVVLDGKQPMPGYKGKMSDKELVDVIVYIRTFAKWGAHATERAIVSFREKRASPDE